MKNQANVVVKKDCHSRTSLSEIYNACRCQTKENTLLNGCVEDPRLQPSGMTPNFTTARSVSPTLRAATYAGYSGRTGFTLIELLVIVLIIGILAAIAVPQYQKTVEQARVTEAKTVATTLRQAIDLYVLQNGVPNGLVEFVGNANGYLDIDLEPVLDCNQINTDICHSNNFGYDIFCRESNAPTSCKIRAWRVPDRTTNSLFYDTAYYRLEWKRNDITGEWSQACIVGPNATKVHQKICAEINDN